MTAKPFFNTHLQDPAQAFKVLWKPSILKVLVFRRSVQTATEHKKSTTEPTLYSTYAFYLARLGKDTGLEEKLTSKCFRCGLANAINSMRREIPPPQSTNSLDRCCIRCRSQSSHTARSHDGRLFRELVITHAQE